MIFFRQCELKKEADHPTPSESWYRKTRWTYTVAWIPEEFCRAGKIVDLKTDNGWDKGWEVTQVYAHRYSEEYLKEHERDYKIQRKASDI